MLQSDPTSAGGADIGAAGLGWRRARPSPSLPEVYRSVGVPAVGLGRVFAFVGPGYLVAVGYMDPGNWATDLAGGSAYGYGLLWVVLLSNLLAMLLQVLAARLGIVTGRDLAQACRDHYRKPFAVAQWLLCEIAICACDLAELVGTAIALELLFGIPLRVGVLATALDVLVVLWLQQHGFRWLEAFVMGLILTTLACFWFNLLLASPDWGDVARGLVPSVSTLTDSGRLYLAIGILGATVMPHNLYLHSSTVQTRRHTPDADGVAHAVRGASIDVVVALAVAFCVNAAILVLSAATFHRSGHHDVTEIQEAHRLLSPMLGTGIASTLFAVALLTSGQSSTLTATLAGQIVMEGFVEIRLRPWVRRLLTRALAIVPAFAVATWFGEGGVAKLLIASQVVLSLQLPFAVVPLLRFTSDRRKMGPFASPPWLVVLAWGAAAIIIGLNVKLLVDLLT